MGVGIIHRTEVPVNSLVPGIRGFTRRLAIIVTATPRGLGHVRNREKDSVTFGGQALSQAGRSITTGISAGASPGIDGTYTENDVSYVDLEVGAGFRGRVTKTVGEEVVKRDIRRSKAAGNAEEFASSLALRIEIHADFEPP